MSSIEQILSATYFNNFCLISSRSMTCIFADSNSVLYETLHYFRHVTTSYWDQCYSRPAIDTGRYIFNVVFQSAHTVHVSPKERIWRREEFVSTRHSSLWAVSMALEEVDILCLIIYVFMTVGDSLYQYYVWRFPLPCKVHYIWYKRHFGTCFYRLLQETGFPVFDPNRCY
jgi:hypothetical protein